LFPLELPILQPGCQCPCFRLQGSAFAYLYMNCSSMKRVVFLLLVLAVVSGHAQRARLEVYLDHKRFATPDGKALVEVYLQINTSSCKLKRNDDKTISAKVEVTEIIKKGETIIDFRKAVIDSPKMVDSLLSDFMDQHRFALNPDNYEMEITVRDLFMDSLNTITTVLPLNISSTPPSIFFSDIQQIEGYKKAEKLGPLTKGGMDLVPFVSNYYSPEFEKLAYYFEIYNSLRLGEGELFLLTQFVREKRTGETVPGLSKSQRQSVKEVIPVLTVFDISKLASGTYELVVEARNKNNEIIAVNSWEFQRNNPETDISLESLLKTDIKATFVDKITNSDTLNEYIFCLRPIALPAEILFIDSVARIQDMNFKKQFFYQFWKNREPVTPEYAWLRYKSTVAMVEKLFATSIKRGYQTDRGAIYLKYGSPDWVLDRPNEPSSYPYQVWQYKKLGQFNNKRFIFYLPDLVTNDYVVLHSDVPGEVRNHRWQQMLNARNSPNIDIDNPWGGNNPHYGGNAGEFFQNPR